MSERKATADELCKAQRLDGDKDCKIDELRGYILQRDKSLREMVEERDRKVDELNRRIVELDEAIRQVSNEAEMVHASIGA